MSRLTDSDRRMIKYFILDKGDVERWAGWEEAKEAVQREHPELIAAITQLKVAKITLRAVVEHVCITEDDE